MKHLSLVVSFVALATVVGSSRGGAQNAAPGQFPFMVAINDEVQYCDGVIIAPTWILTAAHCLIYFSQLAEIYVGSHINGVDGALHPIRSTIIHESFDGWSLVNDIGLIQLDGPLEFSDTVRSIELSDLSASDSACTVVGWGRTETESNPDRLKHINATVVDFELCEVLMADFLGRFHLGPKHVCTWGRAAQGVCWGDAGAPLICDGKVTGIVSYSVGLDCTAEVPDVYTSVAAYVDWIQQYTQG